MCNSYYHDIRHNLFSKGPLSCLIECALQPFLPVSHHLCVCFMLATRSVDSKASTTNGYLPFRVTLNVLTFSSLVVGVPPLLCNVVRASLTSSAVWGNGTHHPFLCNYPSRIMYGAKRTHTHTYICILYVCVLVKALRQVHYGKY